MADPMMTPFIVVLLGDDGYPLHVREGIRVVRAGDYEHAPAIAHSTPPDKVSFAVVAEIVGMPVTVGVKKSAAWAGAVGGVLERARRGQ